MNADFENAHLKVHILIRIISLIGRSFCYARSKIRLRAPQAGTLAVLQLLAVAARGGGGNPGSATAPAAAAAGLGAAAVAGGGVGRVTAASSLCSKTSFLSRYATVSRRSSSLQPYTSRRRTNAFLSRQTPGFGTGHPRLQRVGAAHAESIGTNRGSRSRTIRNEGVVWPGSREYTSWTHDARSGSTDVDGKVCMKFTDGGQGIGRSGGTLVGHGWTWIYGHRWDRGEIRRMSHKVRSIAAVTLCSK